MGFAIIGERKEPILATTELNGRLVCIKALSVHNFFFVGSGANESDTQHLLLDYGANSEVVSRTFITAALIFEKQFILHGIDLDKARSISLEIAQELIELEREVARYFQDEAAAIIRAKVSVSNTIPSIPNIETRCKTIFQKADQVNQRLVALSRLFPKFKDLNEQAHFENLATSFSTAFGEADLLCKFLNENHQFMQSLRLIRDGLEHRAARYKGVRKVTVNNYDSDANSCSLPTIELNDKLQKIPATGLSSLLMTILPKLIAVSEAVIAGLASKHIKSEIPYYQIREIPYLKRRMQYVRFAMWTDFPIGGEGFYHQK